MNFQDFDMYDMNEHEFFFVCHDYGEPRLIEILAIFIFQLSGVV